MRRQGDTIYLTMRHDGGRTFEAPYRGVVSKIVQLQGPSNSGVYEFRLTDGECTRSQLWFIDGEDLDFAREQGREIGAKFQHKKRIPYSQKVKKARKPREKSTGVDPRQMDLF